MCDCSSCSYTDDFANKGFAAWPRGEPKGFSASRAEYASHAKHCGSSGLPKPWRFVPHQPPKFSTYGLVMPIQPAPKFVLDWINARGPIWKAPDRAEARPASPHAPGKAREHFPELDREPEASKIYTMPKPDKKRPGRPPLVAGGMDRVLVTLDADTIAKARKLGGGKLSPGLREAVRRVKTG